MTSSRPDKWDVHTHTTPAPDTYKALERFSQYEYFVRVRECAGAEPCAEIVDCRGQVMRSLERNAFDPRTRIAECDAHGVTMQVISPTPMMIPDEIDDANDAAEICRILNDSNAALVAQFPHRFTALGALPMRFADLAVREMERIRALGMRGIEVNSNVAGLDLDEPRFFAIFEAAQAMDMAVFIHPWGGFMSPAEPRLQARMHAQRNWRPWLIAMGMETALAFDSMRTGGVHERLPRLRVLYAHGGGNFPSLIGRLGHGHASRPELFRNDYATNPYVTLQSCCIYTDSLTHDPFALHLLLQLLGHERVAMGSDYPYPLGELPAAERQIYPGHMIENLPESAEQMDAAWRHFCWLPQEHSAGPRDLPILTATQKRRLLSENAKEWLRWS